ncbi:hypothetical protein PV08_05039 [Exophiala spinifera]|uniref:Heterokaryon incompatibility domain-containing protein n=1 Tax=Exophiala spinifera TaxID=91928 RepID=A0A0D2C2H8_9EURO|nr:uncharacterized protein PV08_05039 [Exophiala spinifera]KIW17844.1 hypothetical protein PV08_05039 [Exophiala spinifera]
MEETEEWLEQSAQFLGYPTTWKTKPGQVYLDNYIYRLNPAKQSSPARKKCDAELTASGKELVKLKVQATAALQGSDNSTWQRHHIADVNTTTLQISKAPNRSRVTAAEKWDPRVAWLVFALNWILALSAVLQWMVFLLLRAMCRYCIPDRQAEQPLTYLPFHCEAPRYARVAASLRDNRNPERQMNTVTDGFSRIGEQTYRRFRPRTLMKRNNDKEPELVKKPPVTARYVFIAFSFRHFPLHTAAGTVSDEAIELARVANKMAGSLGYEYYWCSMSCGAYDGTLTDALEIQNRSIYEISDVIRGADHVIIVLPPTDRQAPTPPLKDLTVDGQPALTEERDDTKQRLKEWAARLWTFPEVILGRSEKIMVCWRKGGSINWYELEKRLFPIQVWNDNETSRQLVEHYGSTNLSRIEFVKIVLECLLHRQVETKVELYYPGDISYVLMGFLRLRPTVNCHDSSLQAFARLSLPADNDRLMERFLCLQPPSRHSNWAEMEDEFHASLWNIEPSIQVSGVGENDTLLIEKAWGAKIQLNKFSDICAADVGFGRHFQGVLAGFAIVPSWSEWLGRSYRRAKLRNTYPRLFGFEGFMSIGEIEEKLFGGPVGLLSWSKNGSPLSRHGPGPEVLESKLHWSDSEDTELGEFGRDSVDVTTRDGTRRVKTYPVIGKEPWGPCDEKCRQAREKRGRCSHPTQEELRQMGRSAMGQDKIFSLIDTVTMTVTVFRAAWPPQALIACGTEGGMERVLVCSYDWTSGVFFKEAVLKFPGKILDSMHRLPTIRLGFQRADRVGTPADRILDRTGLQGISVDQQPH